jgi:hypothetical protein
MQTLILGSFPISGGIWDEDDKENLLSIVVPVFNEEESYPCFMKN